MAGELSASAADHGARTRPGARKTRAAAVSIASNMTLIVLKVVAGVITGSVAIITEAMHSSVDLLASVIAYVSVRKADEPADEDHRYGHEKIENLAAVIEGMLILVGSGIIVFEATRRLAVGAEVQRLGFGIGVVAFSMVANVGVSAFLRRRARDEASVALEGDAAHLSTDAATSGAVLVGLVLVEITGARWLDSAVALCVAVVIVLTGIGILMRSSRVLVDEALPPAEVEAIREAVLSFAGRGVVGYHRLRTRRAGARRHIDLHVQFVSGTSLESAHATAHELQDEIAARLDNVDVLIHLEPEDAVRPGTELAGGGERSRRRAPG
jgi:cation diffusion facilitator family transporter